jgi:ribosome-associated protein
MKNTPGPANIVHVKVRQKNIVPIETEFITLGAFLKLAGAAATGGMAAVMIADGQVTVDGQVCTMRGRKLTKGGKVGAHGKSYHVG